VVGFWVCLMGDLGRILGKQKQINKLLKAGIDLEKIYF
jgi:hypothetical protein